jgi:arylsulfatase A-like enzyme
VVLIVVDTLRADRLSPGHPRRPSAPLAGLLSRATRFEECYAPSPWTVPSTASLMSGRMPSSHGSVAKGDTLASEIDTIAEALRRDGWRTAGFSANPHVSTRTRFDQGFDVFTSFDGEVLSYPDVSELVTPAIEWVDRGGGRPFFLYLQPMNCHGPYRVPEARRSALLGRPPSSGFTYYGTLMKDIMWQRRLERRAEVTKTILRSLGEQYDTAVHHTMAEIARLVTHLERRGLYDDTLIVVTSDHGEELFEHGGFSHGYSLHREVLHVPLVIKVPGQRTGRVVRDRVSLLDVHPTVLAAAGLPPAQGTDGVSLAGLLGRSLGPSWASGRRDLVFEVSWEGRCVARSILSGSLKLVEIESNYEGLRSTPRLYDLGRDRAELMDLALGRKATVRMLSRRLDVKLGIWSQRAVHPPENVLPTMSEEALRSLGYLR